TEVAARFRPRQAHPAGPPPASEGRRAGAVLRPRVARAALRSGDPARRVADAAPGRASGPDGTQRRRQVDAAATRRRADEAHAGTGAQLRPGGALAAEPQRL